MEPISTVTGAWTIAKSAGELTKKLYELGKSIKDREVKQQLDEITDQLRELKHQASSLEDQNRELREKLRFKSDDYEFRIPFHYEKAHPEVALCPKCFAAGIAAPMGEPGQGVSSRYRKCLACNQAVEVDLSPRQGAPRIRTGGWMG